MQGYLYFLGSTYKILNTFIQTGKCGKGKGGKFGNGKNKKSPQSRSARAGLQVSKNNFLLNSN